MTAQQTSTKKYIVSLTAEEREQLAALIGKGKHRAGQLTRARILLKADASEVGDGWTDDRIAAALDTSVATVARVRQQLVEKGFEAVLTRKHSPASAKPRIFDGAAEARLIALACSEPPPAYAGAGSGACAMDVGAFGGGGGGVKDRRACQRQHDPRVKPGDADAKKNILKPHLQKQWVIAPDANAAFVANMEDILDVYQKPRDPDYPLVCVDETLKQLIAETRVPIPAKSGRIVRYDYEYQRNGTANLFMMFGPLEGWRHVKSLPPRRRG